MTIPLLLPHTDEQPAPPHYHAFLLRVWCEDDEVLWHASLQATDGSARRGFADLDQLIAFLRRLCGFPTHGPVLPPTET